MLFKKSSYPTEPLFQKLNILNFEKMKLLKIGIFMWNVINGEVPQTLKDHFSIRRRNCRHNNRNFHLSFGNTDLFKRDITYQGPKRWNYTLTNIKNKVTIPRFKTALKKHLLSIN